MNTYDTDIQDEAFDEDLKGLYESSLLDEDFQQQIVADMQRIPNDKKVLLNDTARVFTEDAQPSVEFIKSIIENIEKNKPQVQRFRSTVVQSKNSLWKKLFYWNNHSFSFLSPGMAIPAALACGFIIGSQLIDLDTGNSQGFGDASGRLARYENGVRNEVGKVNGWGAGKGDADGEIDFASSFKGKDSENMTKQVGNKDISKKAARVVVVHDDIELLRDITKTKQTDKSMDENSVEGKAESIASSTLLNGAKMDDLHSAVRMAMLDTSEERYNKIAKPKKRFNLIGGLVKENRSCRRANKDTMLKQTTASLNHDNDSLEKFIPSLQVNEPSSNSQRRLQSSLKILIAKREKATETASNKELMTEAANTLLLVIKRGDTLSDIARSNYGNSSMYMPIYEANRDKLKSPHVLPEGIVLRIPRVSKLRD